MVSCVTSTSRKSRLSGTLHRQSPLYTWCGRPLISRNISAACCRSQGLPRIWPWHSATVSQPMTITAGDLRHDVGSFLPGQPRHKFRWRFAATDAAFGRFAGNDDLEIVPGGFHQLLCAAASRWPESKGVFPGGSSANWFLTSRLAGSVGQSLPAFETGAADTNLQITRGLCRLYRSMPHAARRHHRASCSAGSQACLVLVRYYRQRPSRFGPCTSWSRSASERRCDGKHARTSRFSVDCDPAGTGHPPDQAHLS